MGLGLIGGALGGALEGAGKAGVAAIHTAQEQYGKEELQRADQEFQATLEDKRQNRADSRLQLAETIRQGGRQADINQDTNPTNVAAKAAAQSGLIAGTSQAEADKKRMLGGVETDIEVERFNKLAPVKRQEAITTEVEKLKAMSTPEMLRAERSIAQAKHIVDPNYVMRAGEDGQVIMVDSHSGNAKIMTGADGKPLISKDPEVLRAATSVINMVTADLKIARAEHQSALANSGADPKAIASANAEWQAAQDKANRLAAPAYSVLYGKAGIAQEPQGRTAPTGRQWDSETGDVLLNGKKIGNAKTADEARKIAAPMADGRNPADPTGLAGVVSGGQPQKSAPAVAGAQQDAKAAAYDAEQREMDAGKRRQFSPEVQAWIDAQSSQRSQKFKEGNAALMDEELKRAQAESRARSGR